MHFKNQIIIYFFIMNFFWNSTNFQNTFELDFLYKTLWDLALKVIAIKQYWIPNRLANSYTGLNVKGG